MVICFGLLTNYSAVQDWMSPGGIVFIDNNDRLCITALQERREIYNQFACCFAIIYAVVICPPDESVGKTFDLLSTSIKKRMNKNSSAVKHLYYLTSKRGFRKLFLTITLQKN